MSELASQTNPVIMRVSLLIKFVQPNGHLLNNMHGVDCFFSKNSLRWPISFLK